MICNKCHLREARYKKLIKQQNEFISQNLCSVCFNVLNKTEAYKVLKVGKEFKREDTFTSNQSASTTINLAELKKQCILTKDETDRNNASTVTKHVDSADEEVFSVLLDSSPAEEFQTARESRKKPEVEKRCRACGFLEKTILETGYVGCDSCYTLLREVVLKSVKYFQGENIKHVGKRTTN